MKLINKDDIKPVCNINKKIHNLQYFWDIFKKMEQICIDNGGVGLAANQVGIDLPLIIIDRNFQFDYYINPEFSPSGDKIVDSVEGCLSDPGKLYKVARYSGINFKATKLQKFDGNLETRVIDNAFYGELSTIFQHEVEHLNGIHIWDIGINIIL